MSILVPRNGRDTRRRAGISGPGAMSPSASGSPMDNRTESVEAVLLTGGIETPYRRAGHGPPILLLADRSDLFQALSHAFRVIQPLHPPGDPHSPDWPRWLQDVVDGLGLGRPALVVDAQLAGLMRQLATTDPDRIGPVVDAGSGAQVLAELGETTQTR